MPFLSTYAKQLGFSSSVVGVIYTVIPICGMLAKPLVGAITDYFHCQKRVFILMMLITATAFVALNYTPHIDVNMKIKFSCDESEAFLNTCVSNTSSVDTCAKETISAYTGEVLCEVSDLFKVKFKYLFGNFFCSYFEGCFERFRSNLILKYDFS